MELHPSVPGLLTIGTVFFVLKQAAELSRQREPIHVFLLAISLAQSTALARRRRVCHRNGGPRGVTRPSEFGAGLRFFRRRGLIAEVQCLGVVGIGGIGGGRRIADAGRRIGRGLGGGRGGLGGGVKPRAAVTYPRLAGL
jgi:hypothetical protein